MTTTNLKQRAMPLMHLAHINCLPGDYGRLLYSAPCDVAHRRVRADAQGWAPALQLQPDGSADVVRHRPGQLNYGVRWLCRTGDQQALGLEPAAAGVSGFTAEKQQGRVRPPGAGAFFQCDSEIGTLTTAEAEREAALIRYVVAGADRRV